MTRGRTYRPTLKGRDMTTTNRNNLKLTALAAAVLTLSACGGSDAVAENKNVKPAYLGEVASAAYDGISDDLLTAGLGMTGLGGAAPAVVDPLSPTSAELRKLAFSTTTAPSSTLPRAAATAPCTAPMSMPKAS